MPTQPIRSNRSVLPAHKPAPEQACGRLARPGLCAAVVLASGLAGSNASAGTDVDSAARAHAAWLRAGVESSIAEWSQPGPPPLNASVLVQTRYMHSIRDTPLAPNGESQTTGFDMPRTQVRLWGNLINRNMTGYVTFDFGDAEGDRGRGRTPSVASGAGSPQLREAYVQYNFTGGREGYYIKAGQFKSSAITEDAIAPEYQLAVERSVANEFFSLGLTQGIAVGRVTDRFAWELTINDGQRYPGNPEPANTDFNSTFEADWAFGGRFDWKIQGDWARFADFTSWRGEDVGIKAGAGFHVQRQGGTNPQDVTADFFLGLADEILHVAWTADLQYESDGWSAFLAYHGHRIMWEIGGNQLTLVNHGLVLQGAMFVNDQTEVFGRWDFISIDPNLIDPGGVDGFPTGEENYHFLTAGVNWYAIPESHAVKLTADVVFTTSDSDTFDIGAGAGNSIFYPDATVTGLLGGSSEELLFRGQVQMLF